MQLQKVDSSNIEAIGFDPGPPAKMQIQFKGGGLYQYTAKDPGDTVTVQKHFDELMKAESKGKHFTAHVRRDTKLVTDKIS